MSGITSGVGVFSGIDRNSIIDQLIAIDSRPKKQFQTRITQIQGLQTALLDINSRLNGLRSSSGAFNLQRIFESVAATSSNNDVLGASAAPGAAAGSYSFTVDRLVTTQQQLSRGFSDTNTTAIGASSFTFEPAAARVDSSTRLSSLNGGSGITRGTVVVTDSTGTATTVDLTRVESVADVVRAFNDALGARASLRVTGDNLTLTDTNASGSGSITVTDATGTSGTAASLGLNVGPTAPGYGEEIIGSQINRVGAGTSLRALNDGLGVFISSTAGTAATPDFKIKTRDGSEIAIDIGDIYDSNGTRTSTAVSDVGGIISRINSQSGGKVVASINSTGSGLQLTDTTTGTTTFEVLENTSGSTTGTTAADLGILGQASGGAGTITGRRVLAGINSTLVKNLHGGTGVGSGLFNVTTRNGNTFSFNISSNASVSDVLSQVTTLSAGRISLSQAANGRGFVLNDNTSGTGTLSVDGEGALALGLFADQSSATSITGFSAQHKFIGTATLLSSLNGGRGVGSGQFQLVDPAGASRTITISPSATTVGDVLSAINSSQGSSRVRARVNNNGDGILLEEVIPSGETAGARAISVRDVSGSVARLLGIAKESLGANGIGGPNRVDGSFERTVVFTATDTLQQVADKINQAGVDAVATIINDGSSAAPNRLSLSARNSGEGGRFVLDTGGLDLGLTTLSEGSNARLFFGSSDPARAVLLSSTSNTFTGLAGGLTVDARSTSSSAVTVSVSTANDTIDKAVADFVKSFNEVLNRVDTLSKYDATTDKRGALLGESTTQLLRGDLTSTILARATGATGRYQTLLDVGFTFDNSGNLTVNTTKLHQALAEDPRGLRDVFAGKAQGASTSTQNVVVNGTTLTGVTVQVNTPGAYTQLGVAEKLVQVIDKYIKPIDGVFTRRSRTLDTQVTGQKDRITALDARLADRRAVLERQFISMESTIGRLQSQGQAISGIRAIA